MPPAAATAAGRARKSRSTDVPRSGSGRPASRSQSEAPADRYDDEFRVTDRRTQRGARASARGASGTGDASPAKASARVARPRGRRLNTPPAPARPARKRREVRVTPSSQTSAFDRVLGPDPSRAGRTATSSGPQPLTMAPRRRIPRFDTGVFAAPAAGIALPHPHIGRPTLKRPKLRRPVIAPPHFSRAGASQQLDRLIRSRLWIAVLGVMLVGIVGMRVEVLKLGTETGSAVQLAGQLQAKNAIDQANDARLDNPARISRLAAKDGMVSPGPTATKFLSAPTNVSAAIRGITAAHASALDSAADTSSATTADIDPSDAWNLTSGTTGTGDTVPSDASTSTDQ
jgi:hypothetical protein